MPPGTDRRTLLIGGWGLLAGCSRPHPGPPVPPTGAPGPTQSRATSPTFTTPSPSSWSFRAMTYNILTGARPPSAFPRVEPSDVRFENRLPGLAEWISGATPDVLAIQENERMPGPVIRPLRRILPLLDGYRAVHPDSNIPILYRADVFAPGGRGIRVISRRRHIRYGSWCRFTHLDTGHQILVANTHLDPHQSAAVFRVRIASLEVLTGWLAEVNEGRNLPVVVLGDFNTPNERDSDGRIHGLTPLYESGLRNSAEIARTTSSAVPGAATLNGMGSRIDGAWRYGAIRHDGRMMDYIWVGSQYRVLNWEVVTGPGLRSIDGAPFFAAGPVPSDHCPVLARVSLPTN